MIKESSMLTGSAGHVNHQHANDSYFTVSPRGWSIGWRHNLSWIRRRCWWRGIDFVFLSWSHFPKNYWHRRIGHESYSIVPLKIRLPSKIYSFNPRKWVLGPWEFGPSLAFWLRRSVKWYGQRLVRCEVTFSSTATPFLPSVAVLWLPNSHYVINRFATSADRATKAITPFLSLPPHPYFTPQAAWQRQGAGCTV